MSKLKLGRELVLETRLLFHALSSISEVINQGMVTAAQRGVLESLLSEDKTIPQIAREKGVSRQHILKQVTPLEEGEYITQRENPEHKRSFYLSLSPKGRKLMKNIISRENKILEELLNEFKEKELENSREVLKLLRGKINNQIIIEDE